MNDALYGQYEIQRNILHFAEDFNQGEFVSWVLTVKILLKFQKTDLVASFKLAIVVSLLLNGIIRQMYQLVVDILYGEFLGGCPDVTFVEPVGLEDPIDSR